MSNARPNRTPRGFIQWCELGVGGRHVLGNEINSGEDRFTFGRIRAEGKVRECRDFCLRLRVVQWCVLFDVVCFFVQHFEVVVPDSICLDLTLIEYIDSDFRMFAPPRRNSWTARSVNGGLDPLDAATKSLIMGTRSCSSRAGGRGQPPPLQSPLRVPPSVGGRKGGQKGGTQGPLPGPQGPISGRVSPASRVGDQVP